MNQTIFGQTKVSLSWLQDSIAIGKIARVSLVAKHPENVLIAFPDSNLDFLPYTYREVQTFPTKTENGISTDSAIYSILSFEIDSLQKIKLPIYEISSQGDSTQVWSNEDQILFSSLVPNPDPKLAFRPNANLAQLPFEVNWLALLIFVLIFSIIFIGLIFAMRTPIKKYLRKRKLKKEWNKVLLEWKKTIENKNEAELLRNINFLFKNWLQPDFELYLASLTPSELNKYFQNNNLLNADNKVNIIEASKLEEKIYFAGEKTSIENIQVIYMKLYEIMETFYNYRIKKIIF